MTAVVGILNKQAVAIAADSAVTIGGSNGRKIFNKANKVFALSKHHPVGIMIYNSASFMGTPWETIIKVYRKQLKEKSFPTVKEYQEDFIVFLHSKKFYSTPDIQLAHFQNFALEVINLPINKILQNQKDIVSSSSNADKAKFLELLENRIDFLIEDINHQSKFCPEFENYTFNDFESYSLSTLNKIIQLRFTENELVISKVLKSKIHQLVYGFLRIQKDSIFTGLIFTGFGEDEIYPQLIALNISMAVDDNLRYFINDNKAVSISNETNSAVRPFAQTDVIDTILSGIDPYLDQIYSTNFESLFKKYNEAILDNIGVKNPLLTEKIKNLNIGALVQEFNEQNRQIRRKKYIQPLMNAVASLSKEDLAEMAESLIYLTYLKRRITFAEESVGGPVDVAVISKGDGFIWIKRKHYFRPELNQHFFENYFTK